MSEVPLYQAKLKALDEELVNVNRMIKIATPALPSFAGAKVHIYMIYIHIYIYICI